MAEERKKQIITLRKRFPFWSLKKIAERVGVKRPYIYYVLRCKGIDTKFNLLDYQILWENFLIYRREK